MNSLVSIAKGFFAMAATIALFSIAALIRSGDAWLGMLYFLILLIPLSAVVYLWHANRTLTSSVGFYEKLSHLLFALLGVALACWAYDLATTFYAIDVARVAFEVNPLGWPLGAVGALVYYVPTVILTYVLLFKLKQKISVYAAIPITLVALLMGSMNLQAGIGNFQFFIMTAWLPVDIHYNLLALVLAADLIYATFLASAVYRQVFRAQRKLVPKENTLL
jgi:hypothetical protein